MSALKTLLKNKNKKSTPKKTKPAESTFTSDSLATNLSQDLVQKNMENERLRKKQKEMENQYNQLVSKQNQELILNEVRGTAKRLKVSDEAMDDVISILGNKFQLKDNKVMPKDKEQDVETYMKEWLDNKQHFLAPQAAQSTFATLPAASRPASQGFQKTGYQEKKPFFEGVNARTEEGMQVITDTILQAAGIPKIKQNVPKR